MKKFKRLSALLVASTIMLSAVSAVTPANAIETTSQVTVQSVEQQIDLLPNSMLEATDVEQTYLQAVNILDEYESLSDADKDSVQNYNKLEELLNPNSSSLNLDNISSIDNSFLKNKTIGYLGSSITYGFQSEGTAFPDYIQKITGSTSIKQAITGGPLAKKEGVRDEISYITQLENGSIDANSNLDALVVQLSTNDASLGIDFGTLSKSYDLKDFDYSTITGAIEYIIAYAKEKWDCPVIFYTNPYLSDEAIKHFVEINGGDVQEIKDVYQTTYQKMVDILLEVQAKWDIDVIDMWNNSSFINTNINLRDYYMCDPIHPYKAGYLFWYTPFIQNQLETILKENEQTTTIDLIQNSDTTYTYNAANDGYLSDYSNCVTPVYYVYAGDISEKQAEKLLTEMNIISNLQEWATSVTVVTPINNAIYNQDDLDAFIKMLGTGVSNVKVIGIDDGATFVNNYLSQKCYAVAGIMTYNGSMDIDGDYNVPLPAYLSNPSSKAKDYYVRANDALKVTENVYQNKNNPLQQVVVSGEETLAEAFENAWNNVFSKNYRQHNEKTEFYMADVAKYTDPYPLIEIANYEELNIQYNPIYNAPLNGEGNYTWFEYIPNDVFEAENGTVPLVISLHGNGNDARLQGETTGWVELASQEKFIVMAPEWQDIVYDSSTHEPGPNFFDCDGLEGDKLIEWLEMLKIKYPQIDASRVYITGLSAGGSASELYGIKYADKFAAVGAVSAPAVDKEEIVSLASDYNGVNVPMIYMCGDHDFFGMIPVDLSSQNSFMVGENTYIQDVDPACEIFPVIQAYQKVNGVEVSEKYDMSLNPYYGIQLDNQNWFKLGDKDALEGTLSNENGVIMKFTAIKDQAHWNYKPEAKYMWEFFVNYSRDLETGAVINTETSNKNETIVTAVKTGDETPLFFLASASVISGIGIYTSRKKRKFN
ncbi:MAG: GDSL-type esterase/lipase family protein [Thomasclavelia sp.]